MNRCRSVGVSPSLPGASRRLLGMYDVDGWWPARTRFEVMLGAILVQNTRWPNAAAALRALRRERRLTPASISTLESAYLSELIRPAGCQSVKASRLQALAAWVERAGGLRSLEALDTDRLRTELLAVHGIGHETADAILCFGFGRPRFVADKYARRWLDRMGLAVSPLQTRAYEPCRKFVEQRLRGTNIDLGELHAAIVLHAQSICRARPNCESCDLRRDCRFPRTV